MQCKPTEIFKSIVPRLVLRRLETLSRKILQTIRPKLHALTLNKLMLLKTPLVWDRKSGTTQHFMPFLNDNSRLHFFYYPYQRRVIRFNISRQLLDSWAFLAINTQFGTISLLCAWSQQLSGDLVLNRFDFFVGGRALHQRYPIVVERQRFTLLVQLLKEVLLLDALHWGDNSLELVLALLLPKSFSKLALLVSFLLCKLLMDRLLLS